MDCLISIPHWFYSNNNLEYLLKDLEFKFQYHTGSIQTNNTLQQDINDLNISIPHWFYSNKKCLIT